MIFTFEFIRKNIPLDWNDVLWGYSRGLVGWRVPVELAKLKALNKTQNRVVDELAKIDKDHDWKIRDLLEELIIEESKPESQSKIKWLYLTMLQLYENKEHEDNIFDLVNDVYIEYDFPEEIITFVPMLPPKDGYVPGAHTINENRDRLLKIWFDYLQRTKIYFESDLV